MHATTEEWVFKAEEDYDSADLLLHGREAPITATACFHCQQCAEKYLKAFLVEHEIDFLRRHELIPLLDLCLRIDQDFGTLLKDLRRLESFAVSARYPGVHIKSGTAEAAMDSAERVRKFVRRKLGIK
jgi:HEPN domain-containing protein